jgi:glycosyltransferase involved in cell wall biosynthesis
VGTPVIGWQRGGVAEILKELYPQGLVAVDDQVTLLIKLKQHIQTPQHVAPVNRFSLDDMCNQTLALYQNIIQPQ